jgi:hypothetical protein
MAGVRKRVKRWALTGLAIIPLVLLSLIVLRAVVTRTIIGKETNSPSDHIVIENWSGDREFYNLSMPIYERRKNATIASIVFEPLFTDSLRRFEILESAWDAGFDTAALKLIRVPLREPRTLNIAAAVIDSAHAWGWKEVTIITADLHAARSRKTYQTEAERYGITVFVQGVPYSDVSSDNWYTNRKGIVTAIQEIAKRVYYEIAVF